MVPLLGPLHIDIIILTTMVNTTDNESMDAYKLRCELVGHSLDVRSVAEYVSTEIIAH